MFHMRMHFKFHTSHAPASLHASYLPRALPPTVTGGALRERLIHIVMSGAHGAALSPWECQGGQRPGPGPHSVCRGLGVRCLALARASIGG
jgi:hypothetical protein